MVILIIIVIIEIRSQMNIIIGLSKKYGKWLIVLIPLALIAFRFIFAEIGRTYYNFKKPLDFDAAIFIEARTSDGMNAGDYGDIALMNLRSGEKYYLNNDRYFDDCPILSFDRERVFFYSKRGGDDLSRIINGVGGGSDLYSISLIDLSIRTYYVNYSESGEKNFGGISCLAPMAGDTAVVYFSYGKLYIYSFKYKTIKKFWVQSEDFDMGYNIGVTPDNKYFFINYSNPMNVPHRDKTFISRLSDTTNLLSFQNYDYKQIHTIGYDTKNEAFYLEYFQLDSLYRSLPIEIYKYFPLEKRVELLYTLNKELERNFVPISMPNDSAVFGLIDGKQISYNYILVSYNPLKGIMRTYDENSPLRASSYSFYYK